MSGEIEPAGTGEPPREKLPNYARRTRAWGGLTIVSAIGIVIPPLGGLAVTVFSMVDAFDSMGLEGGSDPTILSRNISTALFSTAAGLVVSGIFLVLFLVSLVLWLINLSAQSNSARERADPQA